MNEVVVLLYIVSTVDVIEPTGLLLRRTLKFMCRLLLKSLGRFEKKKEEILNYLTKLSKDTKEKNADLWNIYFMTLVPLKEITQFV